MLAHCGPPSTETPTTTIVRYHKKQLNLFNKYLLLVTFEINNNYSIRFKISNSSSTIRFNSIRNEKNTICTALPPAEWHLMGEGHCHYTAVSSLEVLLGPTGWARKYALMIIYTSNTGRFSKFLRYHIPGNLQWSGHYISHQSSVFTSNILLHYLIMKYWFQKTS